MPSRTRLATPTSVNRTTRTRALALAVAAFFLCVSLTAEAKKKKPAKKHKTPAASTKAKGSTKDAAPAEEAESDEASSDSKSSSKTSGGGDDEKEAKNDKPPAAADPDAEAESKGPAKVVRKAPAKETESEGEGGAPFALRIGVGGKALFRNLSWTESNGALAPYTLSPGPESGIWLEAYPAAFATDGFAANIGLFGNFNYGFGASSKTPGPNSVTLTTKYQDFLAGLKVRIPLGNVQPYVAGAFGQQKFHLETPDPSRPNFNYTMIHAGGGVRVQFTPSVDGDLGAGFLIVRDLGSATGEVASSALYPGAAAYGFDAALSVGIRLASMVGVRLGADFRQLGVSLHWKSTDTGAKAGGAIDRYIGAWAGVEVVFDGMGGGAGHGESSGPAPKAAPKAAKKAPEEGEPAVDSTDKEEKASDIE